MARIELLPPRCIRGTSASLPASFQPWLEIALRVRVRVAAWGFEATSWRHWAVPCQGGAPIAASALPYDPGRRGAVPGAPQPGDRAGEIALDEVAAGGAVVTLLAGWRPELHRAGEHGPVSEVGEARADFRRRCLAGLGGAVRSGALGGDAGSATLAAVESAIETRILGAGELELLHARVGVGWYGGGATPAAASGELMAKGGVRASR